MTDVHKSSSIAGFAVGLPGTSNSSPGLTRSASSNALPLTKPVIAPSEPLAAAQAVAARLIILSVSSFALTFSKLIVRL